MRLRRAVEGDTEEAAADDVSAGPSRSYPNRLPADWWRRKGSYFMYMLREFTAVPVAIWMVWSAET